MMRYNFTYDAFNERKRLVSQPGTINDTQQFYSDVYKENFVNFINKDKPKKEVKDESDLEIKDE